MVEVYRRIILSGALVLFSPGSVMQSVVSVFVCLFAINVYGFYTPLRDAADDTLQWVSQWQLFLVLFSALMMKVDAAGDTPRERDLLGWCLAVVVVPGYVLMVLMTVPWDDIKAGADAARGTAGQGLRMSKEATESVEHKIHEVETGAKALGRGMGAVGGGVRRSFGGGAKGERGGEGGGGGGGGLAAKTATQGTAAGLDGGGGGAGSELPAIKGVPPIRPAQPPHSRPPDGRAAAVELEAADSGVYDVGESELSDLGDGEPMRLMTVDASSGRFVEAAPFPVTIATPAEADRPARVVKKTTTTTTTTTIEYVDLTG